VKSKKNDKENVDVSVRNLTTVQYYEYSCQNKRDDKNSKLHGEEGNHDLGLTVCCHALEITIFRPTSLIP
jgi:hypothetical protein